MEIKRGGSPKLTQTLGWLAVSFICAYKTRFGAAGGEMPLIPNTKHANYYWILCKQFRAHRFFSAVLPSIYQFLPCTSLCSPVSSFIIHLHSHSEHQKPISSLNLVLYQNKAAPHASDVMKVCAVLSRGVCSRRWIKTKKEPELCVSWNKSCFELSIPPRQKNRCFPLCSPT